MHDVAAFADGEADGQTSSRVLREAAHRPEVAVAVLMQQQLRGAVGDSIKGAAPAMPDALKAQIAGLMDDADNEAAERATLEAALEVEQPAVAGRINPFAWLPMAIAAMLLVAALLVVNLSDRGSLTGPSGTTVRFSPVQAEDYVKRHVTCGSSIDSLYASDEFPGTIEEVKDTVLQMTHPKDGALPSLDLSAAGYAFEKAGKCHLPGDDAVHLIYKAKPETKREDRVSLWIRRDDGQLRGENEVPQDGKLYLFTPFDEPVGNAAHKMFIWRAGGMVYYLVGDTSTEEVRKTANILLASAQ